MSHLDEAAALEHVVHTLVTRFPSVGIDAVRSVVDEAYRTFDGPVRDYVPLLVERVSRDRLRDAVDGRHPLATPAIPAPESVDPSPTAPVPHGRLAVSA